MIVTEWYSGYYYYKMLFRKPEMSIAQAQIPFFGVSDVCQGENFQQRSWF